VALLPLVVLAAALTFRESRTSLAPPWFLVAFIVLFLVGNFLPVPAPVLEAARLLSGWLLLTAIAALGVRTSLAELARVGPQAATVVIGCTLILLVAAIALEQVIF
jgi:uncharacterized membrane protein YadS